MACSYTVLFNNGTVAHGPATAITAATLGGLTPFTEYALVLLASNAAGDTYVPVASLILDIGYVEHRFFSKAKCL